MRHKQPDIEALRELGPVQFREFLFGLVNGVEFLPRNRWTSKPEDALNEFLARCPFSLQSRLIHESCSILESATAFPPKGIELLVVLIARGPAQIADRYEREQIERRVSNVLSKLGALGAALEPDEAALMRGAAYTGLLRAEVPATPEIWISRCHEVQQPELTKALLAHFSKIAPERIRDLLLGVRAYPTLEDDIERAYSAVLSRFPRFDFSGTLARSGPFLDPRTEGCFRAVLSAIAARQLPN